MVKFNDLKQIIRLKRSVWCYNFNNFSKNTRLEAPSRVPLPSFQLIISIMFPPVFGCQPLFKLDKLEASANLTQPASQPGRNTQKYNIDNNFQFPIKAQKILNE